MQHNSTVPGDNEGKRDLLSFGTKAVDTDERCSMVSVPKQLVNEIAIGPNIPKADQGSEQLVLQQYATNRQDVDSFFVEGPDQNVKRDIENKASYVEHGPGSIESLLGETLSRVADAIDDLMIDEDMKIHGDVLSCDEQIADCNAPSAEQTQHSGNHQVAILQSVSASSLDRLSNAISLDWASQTQIWSGCPSDSEISVHRNDRKSNYTEQNDIVPANNGTLAVKTHGQDSNNKDMTSTSDAELATETYSTEPEDLTGPTARFSPRSLRQRDVSSFWKGRLSGMPKIAPSRPARVEPKSFFANERTFIQWISISLLLATIDSLTPATDIPIVSRLRVGLTCCTGILMIYSVSVYYWRLSLLRQGTPYGYTDRIGPVILVIAVLFGGSVLLVTKYGGNSSDQEVIAIMKEDRDCYRYYHGLSPLEYEPSDVAVQNNLLLIPSLSDVIAISTIWRTTARTLVKLPGTDIEAICVVEQRLFVVSEGNKESNLIELAWNDSKDGLEVVGNWTVAIAFVEGLAYIPGIDGQFFYGDNQGHIHATSIPTHESTGTTLEITHLNHAVFTRGLVDPKIAALQYFDGLLYVVHDNDGIVRAWDLSKGELISEWKLPVPPDSFGTANQIEGFFLEGTSDSAKYLMHLAVDTPAQIWTIAINVDRANGNAIQYPACAF